MNVMDDEFLKKAGERIADLKEEADRLYNGIGTWFRLQEISFEIKRIESAWEVYVMIMYPELVTPRRGRSRKVKV